MTKDCCKSGKKDRKCRRKGDGKVFKLPRKFSKKSCMEEVKGFTKRSSCAPYKGCKKGRSTRRKSKKRRSTKRNGVRNVKVRNGGVRNVRVDVKGVRVRNGGVRKGIVHIQEKTRHVQVIVYYLALIQLIN